MPTAAVSAVQPALNPTSTIISAPIASQTNFTIAPSLQEFKDYYQMNHNLQWVQRPNHSGVTPWAGILDSSTVERKLMLWVPIGTSEVKEMFYSYYLPTTTQLSTQQKKELYNEMVEITSLSLPDWAGGEEWITSSLNDYFSNGQEKFGTYETQVNGKTVLLELSTSHEYDDFGAMFSY